MNPLNVATRGLLCRNTPESIATRGYFCSDIKPIVKEVIKKLLVKGGAVRVQDNFEEIIEKNFLNEDDEILTILKVFIQCQENV